METVYLIHFETPYKHARHYLGYSMNLPTRLKLHKAGTGARLMEVITGAGIRWHVARTWEGGRDVEGMLKAQKNSPRMCPTCRQEHLSQRVFSERRQA